MNHIVNPAWRLLNTKIPPFCFCHETFIRKIFSNFIWQDDMPALENKNKSIRIYKYSYYIILNTVMSY